MTDYAIEGSKEILEKIWDAFEHHDVEDKSSEDWEGNILNKLGEWDRNKYYMRGFIEEYWWADVNHVVLRFYAKEAWQNTDFAKALQNLFPSIKIYWTTEEFDNEVFITNDTEGRYFRERFYADTCIDGNYDSEYFKSEQSMYDWLAELTDDVVQNADDVAEWNEKYKDSGYISIHAYDLV